MKASQPTHSSLTTSVQQHDTLAKTTRKTKTAKARARYSDRLAAMQPVPELTVVQPDTQPIPTPTVVQVAKPNKKVEPSTRVLRSKNKQK